MRGVERRLWKIVEDGVCGKGRLKKAIANNQK